jgi:hypothetical protein
MAARHAEQESLHMFGRTIFGVLAVVLVIAALAGLGTYVYNAGINEGLAEAARQAVASGEPVPVYPGYGVGWGYGHGFGWGFGIIFWILGFFLILWLIRAAFGWGRWGGRGYGHGRDRLDEIHRQLHERERTDASG